ncbi:MAG: hypothetical protein ACI857_002006 [Arenicella sp.]|jgi:hypothetical protein
MKTKKILLNVLMLFLGTSAIAQSAAVSELSTSGVGLTPELAGKLTRIELVKTQKYTVLDQFDMASELSGKGNFNDCYGKNCLIDLGKALQVDYMLSGSIDAFGNKIVVNLKLVDVAGKQIQKTTSNEFQNQPEEVSRMIEITLLELLGLPYDEITKKGLTFNNGVITPTNIGRINNSGPRFGVAVVGGGLADFFTREAIDGGLDIQPVMTNIGYQMEVQYIGTDNFSALFEVIPNIGGMEQGQFVPTLSLLNGFRFGQSGWEFAFGPSFGARKIVSGYDNAEDGIFYTEDEWFSKDYEEWIEVPGNLDSDGNWVNPYIAPSKDIYTKRMDTRGDLEFNVNWLMGVGRTFKSGALNIPVNIYYSGNNFGGVIGASVGFNVARSTKKINQKTY